MIADFNGLLAAPPQAHVGPFYSHDILAFTVKLSENNRRRVRTAAAIRSPPPKPERVSRMGASADPSLPERDQFVVAVHFQGSRGRR